MLYSIVYTVSIMKTACFSRLRQIITHADVGASSDACDKNIIQVSFSSHHCVPGAISGTVLLVCEQFSWFFHVIVIVVNALNLNILYRNTLC